MSTVTDSSRPPAPMLFKVMRPLSAFWSGGAGHWRLPGGGRGLRLPGLAVVGRRPVPFQAAALSGSACAAASRRRVLLGLVAGQRDRPLVLGLVEVALDFLLDEQRELAIAGGGEQHAVGLPQQPLLARDVGSVGGVVAALVGKWAWMSMNLMPLR